MKMNRRTFLIKMNWILAGILGMLGFAGCTRYGPYEYGSPHADFTVKGSVVNKATGKPIEGIQVGYQDIHLMYGIPSTSYMPKAAVSTNAKGEFKLTDRFDAINNDKTLPVYVKDIDGESNGLFQPETLQVDFSNAEHSGKSKNWYYGEYTVNINVELTETSNIG